MQHLVQNCVNGRQFVFQPVLKFADHDLSIRLFLDQALRDIPLQRGIDR